jgi:hypothetical protein
MTMQLHDKNLLVQLHNDPSMIGFILKLTDADSAAFKQMLVWPRSMIGMLSNSNRGVIDFLNKCTEADIIAVTEILDWSPAFVSMVANNTPIIELLNKSTDIDVGSICKMTAWSPSLLGMLYNDNHNVIEFVKKCTADELIYIRDMLQWSPTVFALLSKNDRVLKFLNRITDTELSSIVQFMNWPAVLMTKLRDDPHHLMVIHKMWDLFPDVQVLFKTYFTVYDHIDFDKTEMLDAFSKGQIDSKTWLIDTVAQLELGLGRVWTLCGWIGMLAYLMFLRDEKLSIDTIRSFDIDDKCHTLADTMNRLAVIDGWRFKATTMDVNLLQYDNFIYDTVKRDGSVQELCESADTVINTSCDHMIDNTWWDVIPDGRLVILQNNDFYEHADHGNCCYSIDEFKTKYPMKTILFEGTLDCTLYNRFMLIGYK